MAHMATAISAERAWEALHPGFRSCLDQAWRSLTNEGLPVGAAVSHRSEILGVGRNRVYDARGGSDPLQATPIAHAELNAMATVPDDAALEECELWTTHSPCAMCRAAIEFTAIPTVHYLASDPSEPDVGRYASSGDSDDIWIVVATVFFLHNVVWVSGPDNPMLGANRRHEPEVVDTVHELVAQRSLIDLAHSEATVVEALQRVWRPVAAAATRRSERLGR